MSLEIDSGGQYLVDVEALRRARGCVEAAGGQLQGAQLGVNSWAGALLTRAAWALAACGEHEVARAARISAALGNFRAAWGAFRWRGAGGSALITQCQAQGVRLAKASGDYEKQEYFLTASWEGTWQALLEGQTWQAGLLGGGKLQGQIERASRAVARRIAWPETFTMGGKTYLSQDLTEVQKAALVLAWLEEQSGRKIYGDTGRVYGIWEGGEFSVEAVRVSDSELHLPIARAFAEASGQIPAAEGRIWGYARNLQGNALLLTMAAVVTRLNDWTRKERDLAVKRWPEGKTAAVTGINLPLRVGSKELARDQRSERLRKDNEKLKVRPLPRKPSEVLAHADTVDPYVGGAFEVIGTKNEAGGQSWKLILRGTETWDGLGPCTQDMHTNALELAAVRSDHSAGVIAALEALPIKPADPIEIFGHSQAGMVAANLASDPDLAKRYNIVSVITAGSPVSNAEIPAHINVINMENVDDIVQDLDAKENVNTANHLTVKIDDQVLFDNRFKHGREFYEEALQALEDSGDARIDALLEDNRKRLGMDQKLTEAKAFRVELIRQSSPS